MTDCPSRRQLLAAVGAATATGLAGCTAAERARLNPLAEPPVTMKVVAASGDETEVTCQLDEDAVTEIPALQNPLDELDGAEEGERVERGLSIPEGREISNFFTQQCEEDAGGLVSYDGSWYLVGLTYRDQADHEDHHDHLASETDDGDDTDGDTTESSDADDNSGSGDADDDTETPTQN